MYFYIYILFLPWCFFPYNNICSVGSQFALGSTFLFHLHQESLLAVIITYLSVETPSCSPGDRSQISCATTHCGRGINVTLMDVECTEAQQPPILNVASESHSGSSVPAADPPAGEVRWTSRRSIFYNVIDHLKQLHP